MIIQLANYLSEYIASKLQCNIHIKLATIAIAIAENLTRGHSNYNVGIRDS